MSKRSLTALLLAAVMLSSCGADSKSSFDKKEQPEKAVATVDADLTLPEENSSSGSETSIVTTAAPETVTTTEAVTTTKKPDPEKLKKGVLDGYRFNTAKFPKKVYSNKKLEKAFKEIDKICGDYGYDISFVYKNMDTGAECSFNDYRSYGCCSTIKAPYCKSLLDSGIDLNKNVKINVIWENDGGTVASAGYGSTFTARELIKLAITESDNSAYYNLINTYGFSCLNELNSKVGANYWLGYGYIFTYCTARDLAKQYQDIYKYGANSKRGAWLIRLMQKTDMEDQITAALKKKYNVSHKYGSDWDQNCYHDCAICFAESPYVLIIMTDQVPETEDNNEVFRRLAKQFDIVNEQIYFSK